MRNYGTATMSTAHVPALEPTPEERNQALEFLTQSRNGLFASVQGLSEAQWTFKPAPDRWSIAECVEHVVIVQDFVRANIGNLAAAAASPERDEKQIDALIIARVPDRSTRFPAPERVLPTGRWTPPEALDRYSASCQEIADRLSSASDLRGRAIPHPALGPLDGYQWILAVAGHTIRHTKQILEVAADPLYPAN